jgi:hypothetical protein
MGVGLEGVGGRRVEGGIGLVVRYVRIFWGVREEEV